jgi:hypothetical protein
MRTTASPCAPMLEPVKMIRSIAHVRDPGPGRYAQALAGLPSLAVDPGHSLAGMTMGSQGLSMWFKMTEK